MTKPSDYTEWSAGLWELTVNGTDYTANFNTVEFEERINEPVSWNMEVAGVNASTNADFSKENIAEFKFDGTLAYRGRITHIDPQGNDGRIKLEGMGMAYDLMERKYPSSANSPKVWNGASADTIVSEIVTSNPSNTVNTVDATNNGSVLSSSVDFRMDEEGKLSGLSRLAGDYGGEWWVDESDNFNITDKKELGTSSVITYDDSNTDNIRKKDNAIEGDFDGVVVKGYGDGEDQIKATAGSTTDGDQVLVYTDKTISSNAQAQEKANSLNSSRGSEWQEVHIEIGDTREVRSIGEYVDVQSEKGNVSTTTQYRVVERFYRIDFKNNVEEAKLVCNNREAGFYDKVVKQTEQETQSQTRNMQGSRNVWGDKETGNASNAEPLTIDFYMPSDVEDLNGENRTNKVKLDYSLAPYRQSANEVSSTNNTVTDAPGDNPNNEKVYNVSDNSSADNTVSDLNGSAVSIEKGDPSPSDVNSQGATIANRSHNVASLSSNNERTGGASISADVLFQDGAGNTSSTGQLFANAWNNVALASNLDTNYLFHRVYIEIYDPTATTDIKIALSENGENSIGSQVVYYLDTANTGKTFTHDLGGVTVESAHSTTVFVSGGSQRYDLEMNPDSDVDVGWEMTVVGVKHTHDIPTTPEGVDLLDSADANRLALAKYDGTSSGTNFESSATDETKAERVESTSTNSETTIDGTAQVKGSRVETVEDDLAEGAKANDASIIVDGTNIDGAGNTHGLDQDSEIDVTQYLTDSNGDGKPDVGWHTVEIRPEPAGSVSFVKGRVFSDHHKDSTDS